MLFEVSKNVTRAGYMPPHTKFKMITYKIVSALTLLIVKSLEPMLECITDATKNKNIHLKICEIKTIVTK